MAYARRHIVGGAVETTLTGAITGAPANFAIAASTGWPDGSVGNFLVAIDRPHDVSGETNTNFEVILCSTRSALTVNIVTRGFGGTSSHDHASGARVEVIAGVTDFDEANYAVSKTVALPSGAGSILVSDAANSFVALDGKTSGRILVGNGTTLASVAVSGDATLNSAGAVTLANSGVSAATYGSATQVPVLTVDAKGRATGVVNTTISGTAPGGAAGGTLGGTYPNPTVNTDGSTLETNANALRQKDLGTTTAKLADNAVTRAKLATGMKDSATVATDQSTGSLSFTNLATTGPAVTLTTGTSVLITLSHTSFNDNTDGGCYMGVDISGATTAAASIALATLCENSAGDGNQQFQCSRTFKVAVNAGSNTFTAKYRAKDAGNAHFANRDITVEALPT